MSICLIHSIEHHINYVLLRVVVLNVLYAALLQYLFLLADLNFDLILATFHLMHARENSCHGGFFHFHFKALYIY